MKAGVGRVTCEFILPKASPSFKPMNVTLTCSTCPESISCQRTKLNFHSGRKYNQSIMMLQRDFFSATVTKEHGNQGEDDSFLIFRDRAGPSQWRGLHQFKTGTRFPSCRSIMCNSTETEGRPEVECGWGFGWGRTERPDMRRVWTPCYGVKDFGLHLPGNGKLPRLLEKTKMWSYLSSERQFGDIFT